MKYLQHNRLYCFSPPVMIITFATEVILALYVLLRAKVTSIRALVIAILLCLAVFQLAEFMVCGSRSAEVWPRVGFAAITMLPMLGLWVITALTERKSLERLWLVPLSIAYSAWCGYFVYRFALDSGLALAPECRSNYVFFDMIGISSAHYTVYYYFGLITGAMICFAQSHDDENKERAALRLFGWGYLSFVLPVGFVNLVHPESFEGVPSIMCGFAVFFAVLLVKEFLPIVSEHSKTIKKDNFQRF